MSIGIWVKRILGLALAIAVCLVLLYLRPAKAEPVALAVLDANPVDAVPAADGLVVSQNRSSIELAPADAVPTAGLVFFPGGLVDPRAYANILAPVARAGYLVIIVKAPFDLPITDIGGVNSAINAHPDITEWAIGGHSLGGVAASTFAAGNPTVTPNLLLWASYPLNDMSEIDGLQVYSLSASLDGLTTPADIEASKAKLPPDTGFGVVEGAVHSSFGDYGEQSGDGIPTIDKENAQLQISIATIQWLNAVTGVA